MPLGMNNRALLVLLLGMLSGCMRPAGDIRDYESLMVDHTEVPTSGAVKVTYLGVSTLLIDDGTDQLLIDGWFSRYGLGRVLLGMLRPQPKVIAQRVDDLRINRLRGIFVTHTHYDHAQDAPYVAAHTGAMLYGSSSTLQVGAGAGLAQDDMEQVVADSAYRVGEHFSVTPIASVHTPFPALLRGPMFGEVEDALVPPAHATAYKEGGSYDFLITHVSGVSMLVKASTNYMAGALQGQSVDALFLGVALLGKQDQAFIAEWYAHTVEATSAEVVVPIHWDNFFADYEPGGLTWMPKVLDRNFVTAFERLRVRLQKAERELVLLQGGSSILLSPQN